MLMDKAWNHRLFQLPEEHYISCSHPRCRQKPKYIAIYDYVTGRAGRVSHARRYLCEQHARRFAEKHFLPWPPETRAPRQKIAEALFQAVKEDLRY